MENPGVVKDGCNIPVSKLAGLRARAGGQPREGAQKWPETTMLLASAPSSDDWRMERFVVQDVGMRGCHSSEGRRQKAGPAAASSAVGKSWGVMALALSISSRSPLPPSSTCCRGGACPVRDVLRLQHASVRFGAPDPQIFSTPEDARCTGTQSREPARTFLAYHSSRGSISYNQRPVRPPARPSRPAWDRANPREPVMMRPRRAKSLTAARGVRAPISRRFVRCARPSAPPPTSRPARRIVGGANANSVPPSPLSRPPPPRSCDPRSRAI